LLYKKENLSFDQGNSLIKFLVSEISGFTCGSCVPHFSGAVQRNVCVSLKTYDLFQLTGLGGGDPLCNIEAH